MTSETETRYLSFENFRLDCVSGELRRNGREIRLQPQPVKLLVLLATRQGEVVTRAEIQKALWGEDTFVDFEHGINFSIKQIRDALGDSAEKPRYVETVPRIGYRFVAFSENRGAPEDERERSPYPGLSSFGERDAAFFFGREAEVAALWKRLQGKRMLAVIGHSGAGKTSFVRAGVVASRPEAWGAIVCTPGSAPLRGLGQALVPELSKDPEAPRKLVGFDDPQTAFELVSLWRKDRGEALLVVDQFEELFTLNAPEAQARFAGLLGRLAHDGGVHVLLSMRDDFLIRCAELAPLAPIFLELTPLPALSPEGLKSALVEPAQRRGYRFENEGLVEEMIGSVASARAALPMLAFAVSRLWERRDREKKVLTRDAYEEIGGVAGALAQHAEATLDRIGGDRQGIVREIFRNLVTSDGREPSRSGRRFSRRFRTERPERRF